VSEFHGARIAGMGVISCAGLGVAPLAAACREGRSGVALDPAFGVLTARVSDEVLAAAGSEGPCRAERMTAYALACAMQESGFGALDADTGVIFATTTGNMEMWEAELPRHVAGETTAEQFATSFRHHHIGRPLDGLGVQGPLQVLSSACAAGTQALALACAWLKTGKVRRCVVGATETLTTTTVRGFGCFNLLSASIAAPFDRDRSGINLGEASVFFCLDARTDVAGLGWVLGGATALDAFDMTSPHPEGRGLYHAMRRALLAARLSPQAVDWVSAHGTGTPANDAAEATALAALFGEDAPPVSSTKAVHGHALAASGLLETALALSAIEAGEIPPSVNLREVDPQIKLRLPRRPEPAELSCVLKSTLGFGGVNAAVVLSRRPAPCRL
jgi:3-oxoacyl-(acyl-carrier-protein) synthase